MNVSRCSVSRATAYLAKSCLGRVVCHIPTSSSSAAVKHNRLYVTTSNSRVIDGRKFRIDSNLYQRRFSQIADPQPAKLQELPDQRFWTEVFDELRSNYPAETIEGAKVEKWLKMPRDPVKKGEFVVDLDIAGAIISLRAESVGYVGAHLVKEGEFLEKGMVATNIFSEPEPLPSISESEMSNAMMYAEGSVSELNDRLQDIEEHRSKVLEDLVATYQLCAVHGLGESPMDLIVVQVPGQSDNVFAPISGLYASEITKEQVVEVEMGSGVIKGFAVVKDKRSDVSVDVNGIKLLGGILHARPAWNCVLRIMSPYTSALAAARGASAERIRAAIGFPEQISHDASASIDDLQAEGKRLLQTMADTKILLLSGGRGAIIAGESLVR